MEGVSMPPRDPGTSSDPRSVVLAGRGDTLSDEVLLSLALGRRAALQIGRLTSFENVPQALWRIAPEELVEVEGVGPVGAARLLACLEISRRASYTTSSARPIVSTPEDVVSLCGPQMRGMDREHFWALALSTKNRLLRIFEVSVGSLNASIVHPRELFKEAVRVSAASLIVVHNHPSGDPTPSGADVQLTRRLAKAGDVLGIELLDHVVIGDGGDHESLRDLGLM
jgi:DNA repair protein RadC